LTQHGEQPQQLRLPPPRTYTRTDFTALRAFVQRSPTVTIARLYYDLDRSPHAATAEATERYLTTMRDDLVHLALLPCSTALADNLNASIKQHGSGRLTAVTLRRVEHASTLSAAIPLTTHLAHLWFRPLIAQQPGGEGIGTLGTYRILQCARGEMGGAWCRGWARCGRAPWSPGCDAIRRHSA
jgi:hypothetical protein